MPDNTKSSDFAGRTVTAKITRTNSVFPASKDPVYQTAYGPLRSGQQITTALRDPRSGQVIGYRNTAGQRVDAAGVPIEVAARKQAAEDAAKKREESVSAYRREALRQQTAIGNRKLTVDGVEVKPFGWGMPNTADVQIDSATGQVTDENGNDITRTRRGQIAAQRAAATAVFSGLNLPDLTGAEQFVMSYGLGIDPVTGEKAAPKPEDDFDSLGARARRKGPQQPQQNMMTITQAVRWLRQLSVKDTGAYNQMVIALRNAKYLTGRDEDLPLNGWSEEVGKALAYAANDLAGAYQEGEERDLPTWLADRGKTFAESLAEEEAANAYHPVERTYTDPAALANEARDAAQNLLGRALTPEEEARFTSHFKGLESGMYDQIDAAGRAKTAATVTNPNASGQADAFVRSPEFDADRTKQLTGSYMDALMKLLGG